MTVPKNQIELALHDKSVLLEKMYKKKELLDSNFLYEPFEH